MRLLTLAVLLTLASIACAGNTTTVTEKDVDSDIPTPRMATNPTLTVAESEYRKAQRARGVFVGSIPVGQYRGESEARSHHCITQDPPIHADFWAMAYQSAYRAVGNTYEDRNVDADGNIVEGGYLEPILITDRKLSGQ